MKFYENLYLKIIFVTILLCTLGLVMVYSASYYTCSNSSICNYDSMYYMKKQFMYMLMGFSIIVLGCFVNYINVLRRLNFIVYGISILCIFLLWSPLGISSHGARRWIRLAGIQFQVAELVKITLIVTLAFVINKYDRYLKETKFTLLLWGVGFVPALLIIVLSSDLSSGIVIAVITFGISWIVTQTTRLHLATGVTVGSFAILYVLKIAKNLPSQEELEHLSYRVSRIAAWIAPEKYAQEQGYQILNARYAVGRGGLMGQGIGRSIMAHGFIPEAHNDMIFAILCEELGAVGAMMLVFMLVYLICKIIRVACYAQTLYESIIATGIAIHLCFQSLINIAVALNAFPNTGVPLPFISYGGTTVLCNLFEIALVVNISRRHDVAQRRRSGQIEENKTLGCH